MRLLSRMILVYLYVMLISVRETELSLVFQKVTITTVHAAKGLEWPVVFIPAGKRLVSFEMVTEVYVSRARNVPFVPMYRSPGDRGRASATLCCHD